MTQERHPQPDRSEQERRRDLAWIRENQTLFWLVASTACEEIGYGALMVDLIHKPLERGHPFSYYAEEELEVQDQQLQQHLQDYDPGREFIVVLLKPSGRTDVYRCARSATGWMGDLETQTRYGAAAPGV